MKVKLEVDERDVFELSGPLHHLQPLWSDAGQKRAVIACLVQSVYVAEKDRQLGLEGTESALAPKWSAPFNYKIWRTIRGEGGELRGAVFRWSRRLALFWPRPPGAPKLVLALRGTMPYGETLESDLLTDLELLRQRLHTTTRFAQALDMAKEALQKGSLGRTKKRLCLAGHSLGAALCLLLGRTLAKDGEGGGVEVDTHLFNPPFPSPPLERIRNPTWQIALHALHKVAIASLALVVQNEESQREGLRDFLALKGWQPHIYVNSYDPICCSYIGYFASRGYALRFGGANLGQLVSHNSLGSLVLSLFGESKPYHLIPSAHLYVIDDKSLRNLKQAHGMHQWWSPRPQVIHREISFNVEESNNHASVDIHLSRGEELM